MDEFIPELVNDVLRTMSESAQGRTFTRRDAEELIRGYLDGHDGIYREYGLPTGEVEAVIERYRWEGAVRTAEIRV